MRRRRIAIIGAGAGGLSAAALSSRDFDVTVFERASSPGGKIRQTSVGDGAIDAGPTVFTMRWVFEEIFRDAGHSFDRIVSTRKLDVLARHFWRDGTALDLHADLEKTVDAIRRFAGGDDAQSYPKFCERARKTYDILLNPFILQHKPSLLKLMLKRDPITLSGINPYTTLWNKLEKRFRDPRLRQLFARYATYAGSSPFHAPATLMLITHVEQNGVWMIDGGMQRIAHAFAEIASSNGAAFHYDTHVEEIVASNGRVAGVKLSSGERIEADIVVFNGDPSALTAGYLGPSVRNAVTSAPRAALSQSAVTFTMRARRPSLDLSVHNIFFSNDYKAEFASVFGDQRVPRVPTTYIFAPDRLDSPEGSDTERLFFLINAPPARDDNPHTEKELEICRKAMIDHLAVCGLRLEPVPGTTTMTSPAHFAAMFPGSKGALYGLANHGWRASFQRPGIRSRIRGLYLAGGGVHPGAGVPMAALSGRAAFEAIKKDYNST